MTDGGGSPRGHPAGTPERPATQAGWGRATLCCQERCLLRPQGVGRGLVGSQQPGEGRLTFSDENSTQAAGGWLIRAGGLSIPSGFPPSFVYSFIDPPFQLRGLGGERGLSHLPRAHMNTGDTPVPAMLPHEHGVSCPPCACSTRSTGRSGSWALSSRGALPLGSLGIADTPPPAPSPGAQGWWPTGTCPQVS